MAANTILGQQSLLPSSLKNGLLTFLCETIRRGYKKSGGITGQAANCGFWPSGIREQTKSSERTIGDSEELNRNRIKVESFHASTLASISIS